MQKKKVAKRLLILSVLMTLILVVSHATDFTMAWMGKETEPLVNTFTFGNIGIELTETDTNDGDADHTTNTYYMDLINKNIVKDPKVTVYEDSEDCWLFVKLEKSNNFDTFLEYTIEEGWEQLETYEGIYFRKVENVENDIVYSLFKDHTVILKTTEEVTHTSLNNLDEETYPTLSITAYAIQLDGFATEKIAWAEIQLSDN